MANTKKFLIFLWKNYKSLLFQWKSTLFVFVTCISLLCFYLAATNNTRITEEVIYPPSNVEHSLAAFLPGGDEDVICYAPETPYTEHLMSRVHADLGINYDRLCPFSNESDMLIYMDERKTTRSFAISFHDFPQKNASLTKKQLRYTISSTNTKQSTRRIFLNDEQAVGVSEFDDYIQSGFFVLQHTIDKDFIRLEASEPKTQIEVAPFPRIEMEEIDTTRLNVFGLLFLVFLNLILLNIMLVPLVEEKQDGVREFLMLTTRGCVFDDLAFFITRFVVCLLFTFFAIILGYCLDAFKPIGILLVCVLFILFVISSMCYTFLISAFFNSVYFAKVGGFIAYFVPFALLCFGGDILQHFKFLISGNTYLEGINSFEIFAIKNRIIHFDDLTINITQSCWKLSSVYLALIIQCFFYGFLYFYISNVFPSNGSVRKPYHFIFTSLFNCFGRRTEDLSSTETLNSEAAVMIRNLTKDFCYGLTNRSVNRVVDKLDMNIEKNRVTVLLGHNGAGKTTTINMIIGLVEKTSGDIIVNGHKEMEAYRHLIGYCPQHNIFMQYLTCKEHFVFFARLRGLDATQADESAKKLIEDLNLYDKQNEVAKNLSGGMKRRLSLGLAISGNTKIIILDEPSSGLDPESRRELWNVIIELKKKNSILVTTHYMEEAEILGDTVFIMVKGQIACAGETLDLKRKYGNGYTLTLSVNENFNKQKVMDIIKRYVRGAEIKSVVKPTYRIVLPYESQHYFENALKELEDSESSLGISAMSIANSTLEDVFLNHNRGDEVDSILTPSKNEVNYERFENVPITSSTAVGHQISSVLYKKLIYIKSCILYMLFMYSISFAALGLAFLAINADLSCSDVAKPFILNINQLNGCKILLQIPKKYDRYKRALVNEIENQNSLPEILSSGVRIEDELLKMQSNKLQEFYEIVFGAIELYENEDHEPIFRVLYSGNAIHSSASMLNLIDNVLLKMEAGENTLIETSNMPIIRPTPLSPSKLEYYSSIIPVGLFFYMLYYISLPFKEQKSEFKMLQPTSGFIYWFTFTVFDAIMHAIVCVLLYLMLKAFDNVYTDSEKIWLMTTFMFYGFAYLPVMYIFANSFRSMSSLSSCIFIIFTISTIMPVITSGSLQAMQEYSAVISLMNILPDFGLKHQLRVINENFFISRRAESSGGLSVDSFSTSNKVGKQSEILNTMEFYFYMAAVMIVSEFLLIYIWDNVNRRQTITEWFSFSRCSFRRSKSQQEPCLNENSDVQDVKKEVEKILKSKDQKNHSLVVNDLHKRYGTLKAVQGIDFVVEPSECFGLLGLNGAGKTSTFQMITANQKISQGNVSINGIDIRKDKNLYKYSYGYCPQPHALNEFMTSYQILTYMALIRGIQFKNIDKEVTKWLRQMDFEKYRDVPIWRYSGGTKRKLSTAMAMIGDPAVIFLDEPTTGVDPKSRRFMWECIQKFQREKKTIVLTSHSMDECEYLCNRLAIMDKGRFRCIGFIPNLKVNLGSGYTLTLKIKEDSQRKAELLNQIRQQFICTLREEHAGVSTYFVKERPILWSTVFARIDKLFREYCDVLQDYSVNEITLEDIFLNFKKIDVKEV